MGFFKTLLASILGVIIGSALLGFVGIMILAIVGSQGVDVPEKAVLKMKLSAPISEMGYQDPLSELDLPGSGSNTVGLMDIMKALKNAAADDRIEGIYLNTEFVSAGFATLTEIRNSLLEFKESGKFIYAYGDYMSEGAYYVASVADSIFLNPVGMMELNGLASERMFYKGMFDKFGITPEIVKVGSYKSAVEPYMRENMSEESRFQTQTYLDSLYNFYAREVSKTRGIAYEDFLAISDSMKARTAKDAVSLGLISDVANYDRVEAALKKSLAIKPDSKKKIKFVSLSKYIKSEDVIEENDSKNRIAVIVGDGAIISGEGEKGYIGGHRIAKQIKKAREDKKVKAIVLRINSPGGSALASDIMWREVQLTKGVKPIIASMSDVAASGGYYMAMGCDKIVAMPNTITGSIGIFATLFEVEKLLNNELGITIDEVTTGEYSNLGSPTNAFTQGERDVLQAMINEGYDNFTKKAAQGRGMTQDDLKKVAEGRVWIGAEAQKIGLVDILGDFNKALEVAAEAAELEADDYKVKFYGPKKPELFGDLPFEAAARMKDNMIREELGELYTVYKNIQQLRHLQGVQALMPFEVVIR